MLRKYEQIVESYRKNKVTEMLSNGSVDHGAVLFHNIFEAAISERLDIKLVTGSLQKDFYAQLTQKLVTLLRTNSVSVVLVSPDNSQLASNKFLDALLSSPNGSVRTNTAALDSNHFVVAGDSTYRIELDHARGMAAANFNDSGLGKRLVQKFDELYENGIPLDQELASNREKVEQVKV